MTTIYLVRHAHADWTPNDARSLSPRGRASAHALAEQFAAAGISALYSSPSARARETIDPLAQRLRIEPVIIDDLRERELVLTTSAEEFATACAATWRAADDSYRGSEPNAVAQARGAAVVRGLVERHPGKRVMVATHGTLLALILNAFESRLGYDFWRTLTFPDVFAVTFAPARPVEISRAWSPPDGEFSTA